jgi:hypothetical protein
MSLHIDGYDIKVLGGKYDHKKKKSIPNTEIAQASSKEMIKGSELLSIIDTLKDVHEAGCDIFVSVVMKQHTYEGE